MAIGRPRFNFTSLNSPSDDAVARVPHGKPFRHLNVRFIAHNGLNSDIAPCLKSASNGLMHRSKKDLYSITSSARLSSDCGTVMLNIAFGSWLARMIIIR